jgi:transcriptional regulator with XRE-family HTH domain
MDFGEWIRSIRKAQKVDIRTLAGQTGVEASTISRVENTRTQVTLSTAIRICEGLGVTGHDLLEAVQEKHISYQKDNRLTPDETIPTLENVETFFTALHSNPQEGYYILSSLLKKVINLRGSGSETIQRESLHTFNPEGMPVLLFQSPIYQFEVQYPPDIQPKDIIAIYTQEGALTLVDIGMYIKKIRREKQITLAHLEKVAKVSSSVLSRLETGLMEQVKLADILNLDEQLGQDGKLLLMYWRAYRLNDLLSRSEKKVANHSSAMLPEQYEKLTAVFIILHRWLQQLLTIAS